MHHIALPHAHSIKVHQRLNSFGRGAKHTLFVTAKAMETASETRGTREELEVRLGDLERKKSSLENEISALVEQIPILEMSKYAALLESGNSSLTLVRDMLRALAEGKPAFEHEADSRTTSN
jgi:hypothetical protein